MTLLVFVKAPVPGRVKTRLAAELGQEGAARAYRSMAARVRDAALGLGGVRLVWVYDPAPAFPDLGWLLGARAAPARGARRPEVFRQSRGGLGARLRAAFARAFREGGGPVCAIGTDSPGLTTKALKRAFALLREDPVVLGPARDGGYYLIGMREWRPELFRDIPWSTSRVLGETLEAARRTGIAARLLPALSDVDTAEDWERLGSGGLFQETQGA